MRRNRMWIAAMVLGIMLVTTVCYLTMRNNVGRQYADGKLVQDEDTDFQELTMLRIKWS